MDATLSAQNHAETIRKLERLNQLETITAEQRIRIEKYRTMYETLKAENEQLENDKMKRNSDAEQLKNDMDVIQTRCQELLSQARVERDQKIEECEELRMKVLTPQKMEVMKIKLLEEVELPYKQRLEAMEGEIDKYRNEFNRLRYDYSFLKSEYEHELAQKKTSHEELYAKFELEKEGLQKDIRSLKEELENKNPVDLHKIRNLQKDNVQLNLRVKSLTSELEELRDAKDTNNMQIDQTARLQTRQISELSLQCKSLEAEKETCKLQLDRIQKELENSTREQDTMSNDLHKKERENLQLKSQLEESKHNSKMELNNMKLSLMKERGELEQERDILRMELNILKNKSVVNEENCERLKKNIEEKEQEAMRRVQAVKEEEWAQINKLENIKAQLESQISTMEQQKVDSDSQHKTQVEQLEDSLKLERESADSINRELSIMKGALVQEKQKTKNLELDVKTLLEVKHKHQKLVQEYDSVVVSEQDLKNEVDKLLNTIELLRKELDTRQEDMKLERDIHQKNMVDNKKAFDEKHLKISEQYKDLQREHKELKRKYEKLSHSAKKKTKKLKAELALITEETKYLKSQQEHYAVEKQTLLKNLNFEQQRMKRRFDKYRHRQQQFSHVLNGTNFNMTECAEFSPIKKTSSFLIPDNLFTGFPPKSNVEPLGDGYVQDASVTNGL